MLPSLSSQWVVPDPRQGWFPGRHPGLASPAGQPAVTVWPSVLQQDNLHRQVGGWASELCRAVRGRRGPADLAHPGTGGYW